MITRNLLRFLAGSFLLALGLPQGHAAVKVSEGDYQKYTSLEYAQALFDARKTWARRDKDKLAAAEAELAKSWQESGWTKERYGEIEEAIGEVVSNLRAAKQGELSAEDLKSCLAECDPATVATVKAHFDELEKANPASRAEKQVREELERERRGDAPTEAQLTGTWVFDCDATIEWMMPGMHGPEMDKVKADMTAKVGKPSYAFGPGNAVEVRSKGPDGAEKVEHAVYRLDGNTIYFKAPTGGREHSLNIGLRKGKLQMGLGFGMSVFSRQ